MITKNIVITNKIGIHARPAGLIVKECRKFESIMTIKKNNVEANMKSIYSLMKLQVKQGDLVTIEADGPDEAHALEDIILLINTNLE
jgi:phosphocarrier protein